MKRLVLIGLVMLWASSAPAAVWYVNKAATGSNNGMSWANAFTNIQPAINAAAASDEIWVAAGNYNEGRPDGEGALILKANVALYGGFAGWEVARAQRNWEANESIINGATSRAGNPAYSVVRVTVSNAILDGFIIQGGNANGSGAASTQRGGGVFVEGQSFTMRNCTVRNNNATVAGGGMTIRNCFTVDGRTVIVEFCTFHNNTSSAGVNTADIGLGGGLNLQETDARIHSNTFHTNSARYGGGIYVVKTYAGIGTGQTHRRPQIYNCVFYSNIAREVGGGIHNHNAATDIRNCTLVDNTSQTVGTEQPSNNAGAIGLTNSACLPRCPGDAATQGQPLVYNCVVVRNSGDQIFTFFGSFNMSEVGNYENASLPGDLFQNAGARDYRPNGGGAGLSQLIDASTAAESTPITIDRDGTARPLNSTTGNAGGDKDKGAYEYDQLAPSLTCQNRSYNLSTADGVRVYAADLIASSSDAGGVKWRELDGGYFEVNCSKVGVNNVTVRVRDFRGNETTCVAQVTVNDNVPPDAVCVASPLTVNLSSPTVNASALDGGSTDNCGITTRLIDGAPSKTFTCADLGPQTVTLRVQDATGNFDTCTVQVNVVDDVPPVPVCQNVTVNVADGGTVTAEDVDNGSADACGGPLTLSLQGGDIDVTCANLGANPVTLVVQDNLGNTATCNATVTIVDSTPPTPVCRDITVYLDANDNVTIAPEDIDGGSTDNCGITTRTINGAASVTLGCANVGANNLTLGLVDVGGHPASCQATVTVVDESVNGPTPLNPAAILSYTPITFSVSVVSGADNWFSPPYTYQWQFSTDNIIWNSLADGSYSALRPGRNPDIDPLLDPINAYLVDVPYTIAGATTNALTIDHALEDVHEGFYRCIVTDSASTMLSYGCSASNTTQLNVNPQVVILRNPQGGQFYEGNNESQDAVAFGGSAPQNYGYSWRLDGTPIDNSNVNPYTFVADPNPPTPSGLGLISTTGSPGSYRVVITDASIGGGAGVKQSGAGIVDVQPAVDVTVPFATDTKNTTQTFSVTASVTGGYPGYTWSWAWNGQPLQNGQPHPSGSGATVSGVDTDTLSVSGLEQADAGTYTVTAVDSLGTDAKSSDSDTVVLSVTNNLMVATSPQDADVYVNDTVSFDVTVAGGDQGSYEFDWKWDFGAGEITMPPAGAHPSGSGATVNEQLISANTHRLTLTGVSLAGQSDNGEYYCIVRDANPLNEEATSAAAVLGVYAPVQITSQPQSLNRYTGQSAVFSVQATGGVRNTRGFQWEVNTGLGWSTLVNGGNVSGATTSTLTVSPLIAGNDNTQYRCRVTAPASDVTSPNSNREQVSGEATLRVSSPLVVLNDPVDVQAYVIDPPFTLKSEFEGGMPFGSTPLYQTSWRRTGVDPVSPEVSAGAGTLVIGNPNTASLQVSPGTLSPGFYDFRVDLTDQVETTGTGSARVQIANSLNFDQPLQNAVVREGSDFDWSVVVSGGILPLNYQWQKQIDDGTKALVWVDVPDDATHNGVDTDTLEFTNISFDDAGTYRVVVSDSGTQQLTSSAQLVVENALPVGGGLGLMALAALSALGGALGIRRRR